MKIWILKTFFKEEYKILQNVEQCHRDWNDILEHSYCLSPSTKWSKERRKGYIEGIENAREIAKHKIKFINEE